MLITHLKPSELWGKSVFDTDGRCLGKVVGIAGRRGVVRKVIVERAWRGRSAVVVIPADTGGGVVVLPALKRDGRPELRLLH
jgi:sporulation protein YlmC with PRC-barrel domain